MTLPNFRHMFDGVFECGGDASGNVQVLLLQVLKAYETRGFVILRAFNETGFLEALTRLDKLHAEGEPALEAADWEEGGTDEDI
jgi:hypothetical protein